MSINTEFDNLNDVSDVKDFDQSQVKEPNILETPDVYQEFDEIEHEVNRQTHAVNEVSLFTEKLTDAQVVRRDDVLALESLVGELESLPHINSYTLDLSLVNYQVTQESAVGAVVKFVVKLAKQIMQYIVTAFNFIKTQAANMLRRSSYVDDTAKQEDVKENVKKADTKVKDAPGKADAVKTNSTDVKNAARIVKINKDLRKLLYPKFTELGSLSLGGDINVNLLVDEMCIQRLKPFYSTFFKSVYERDIVLKNILSFLTRRVNSDFALIVTRTEELFKLDITQPPPIRYTKLYDDVPEQLIEFITHYNTGLNLSNGSNDHYGDAVTVAHNIARSITSIAVTHELPEPRAILKIDLDWLSDLFDDNLNIVSNDIQSKFDSMKKSFKILEKNTASLHPAIQKDIMTLYSDWITINKMVTVITVFRARADAIYQNIDILTNLIIDVTDIITA